MLKKCPIMDIVQEGGVHPLKYKILEISPGPDSIELYL